MPPMTAKERAHDFFQYVLKKRFPICDVEIMHTSSNTSYVDILTTLLRNITVRFDDGKSMADVAHDFMSHEDYAVPFNQVKRKVRRIIMLDDKNKDLDFSKRHPR